MLLLLGITACGATELIEPKIGQTADAPLLRASLLAASCTYQNSYGYIPDCWPTSQVIRLQSAPRSLATDQEFAVTNWNHFLTQDDLAPRFEVSSEGSSYDVALVATEQSTFYCGTFSEQRDSIVIRGFGGTGSCQLNAHKGHWASAYLQELAGVLGWDESVEAGGLTLFEEGLTTGCVLYLDPYQPNGSRFINTAVCAHEADGVILSYRGEESSVGTGRMFRDTLYMHVAMTPSATTVALGDSIQIVADSFYSGGFLGAGGPQLMGLGSAKGHIPVSKAVGPGEISWFTRAPSVISPRNNGWFLAQGAGSAWVGARAVGAPSPATRWWSPLVQRGDSLLLTVPPPPPPEFVVTSDQTPIQTVGGHTFTSHLSGPTTPIFWRVDDSRTVAIDPDTAFATSGHQVLLQVAPGSYTLRFSVALSPAGPWQSQDIPVCTDEGLDGGMDRGNRTGDSTNAVGGCPPPPGGGEQ